jgi:hypothetical protein
MGLTLATVATAPAEIEHITPGVSRIAVWLDTAVSTLGRHLQWFRAGGETTSITRSTVDADNVTAQIYSIREPKRVRKFILQHNELLPYLWELPSRVVEAFDGLHPLSLELVDDPETHVGPPELFVVIDAGGSLDGRLHLLRHLDEQWWRSVPRDIHRLMNVDVNVDSDDSHRR